MSKFKSLVFVALLVATLNSCKKSTDDGPGEEPRQQDIASIDTRVQNIMTTYGAPGASVAFSHHGKLVYRKGYGVADKTTNEKVTTDHRFRVASISKTITSIAIMKLMQEGKLSLTQKVFGTGAILGTTYGTAPYSTNVSNLTVRDLLQHTYGGWSNAYPSDPCLQMPTADVTALMNYTLNNRPVTSAPGTTYQYSNFGYVVLGRIIEKLSGKGYAAYIREDIMRPLGITQTEIAGLTLADRKPNEVVYYAQGPAATELAAMYNEPVPRNDGAMGWITTPTELLKLITAVDSSATRPDILSPATLTAMRTPSSINPFYAAGMYVENDPVAGGSIWYHFGSLPGTQAVFFRMTNGWCASFVMNTRYSTSSNTAQNAFTQMLLDIVADSNIKWQDIDQF